MLLCFSQGTLDSYLWLTYHVCHLVGLISGDQASFTDSKDTTGLVALGVLTLQHQLKDKW